MYHYVTILKIWAFKMVRKCTKNSKKWMSQNGVVLAAIDVQSRKVYLSSVIFKIDVHKVIDVRQDN